MTERPKRAALATCTLCEAACGIVVDVEDDRVVGIRGDDLDPQSRGYICPKATALADLHRDPDRLRTPLVRDRICESWGPLRPASWEEALSIAGTGLRRVRRAHGRDALAVYYGNPTAHNLGLLSYGLVFTRALRTRNLYSASTADQMPQMLVSERMYGHLGLVPVPDLDRTDHLLIVGANPLVSNGSLMTAPDMKRRLRDIQARGGRVVVLDPRRTETARVADEHVFVRPGTDAYVLLAMIHVLFHEGLVRLGRLAAFTDGLDAIATASRVFTPSRVAGITGVDAETIVRLARTFASAPRAAAYGRVGMCTQRHGSTSAWLVQVLNVLTGRLDAEGGVMFTTPAIELLHLLEKVGMGRGYDRFRSRVRGLPETAGELPIATLADEIERPGEGQVRAVLTIAGNPALSAPNGPRLERALEHVDFMVSIDGYVNETTRHAHVILPPVSPLSRSHYDLALHNFGVRNAAKYVPPVFEKGADERHDWEILAALSGWLFAPGGDAPVDVARRAMTAALSAGPEAILEAGLRAGPYGLRKGRASLSLDVLRAHPHGLDLGPLEPRLPGALFTKGKRVALAPEVFLEEARALDDELARTTHAPELVLVGRREMRTNNSWLHNAHRLVKGPRRCTVRVHPNDAASRGLVTGENVRVRSRVGDVVVPLEVTDEMMPGVVSLPHGWGHDRPGTRMAVAAAHAGVSVNDLTDDTFLDRVTGTAAFSGVPVTIERAQPVTAATAASD